MDMESTQGGLGFVMVSRNKHMRWRAIGPGEEGDVRAEGAGCLGQGSPDGLGFLARPLAFATRFHVVRTVSFEQSHCSSTTAVPRIPDVTGGCTSTSTCVRYDCTRVRDWTGSYYTARTSMANPPLPDWPTTTIEGRTQAQTFFSARNMTGYVQE